MKTWRPHKAGFIVLYALSALSLADFVYGIYRQVFTAHDTVYDSFSTFNYVIFVLVIVIRFFFDKKSAKIMTADLKAFQESLAAKEDQK